MGVESHDVHEHDSKTLKTAQASADENRKMPVLTAVVDRGYRGCKRKVDTEIILPNAPLKRDNEKARQRKRKLCQKRSALAIEPIIGHLKHDDRLSKNWLNGSEGDKINLLMAACALNIKKWMIAFFLFEINGVLLACIAFKTSSSKLEYFYLTLLITAIYR